MTAPATLPPVKTIYEPYTGPFTGTLSTYTSSKTGLRYSFKGPGPRVEKGKHYMAELDGTKIRLIPVVMG